MEFGDEDKFLIEKSLLRRFSLVNFENDYFDDFFVTINLIEINQKEIMMFITDFCYSPFKPYELITSSQSRLHSLEDK